MLKIKNVYKKNRHVMNFVPFIDVVFMLLMYFFVAAEIRPTEADFMTNLPAGSGQLDRKVPAKEAYRVYLAKTDAACTNVTVSINNDPLGTAPAAFKTLETRLVAVSNKENMLLVIDGDSDVKVQFIANALDSAMAAKVPGITFGKPRAGS